LSSGKEEDADCTRVGGEKQDSMRLFGGKGLCKGRGRGCALSPKREASFLGEGAIYFQRLKTRGRGSGPLHGGIRPIFHKRGPKDPKVKADNGGKVCQLKNGAPVRNLP